MGFAAAVMASTIAGRAAGLLTVAFGLVGYIVVPIPLPPNGFVELLIGYTLVSGTFTWIVAGRYQAEAALRESENRLWRVVTSLPVVFWAIDRDGYVTLVQGKGLELVNLKSAELLGRSVLELYRDVPEVIENTERALRGETFNAIVGVREAVVEMWYSPIRDDQGLVVGAIAVSLDVTGRARLEQQYLQAQKLESVGQLAAGVAHDFNNLLTAIGGYSEMVMMSLDVEDSRRDTLQEVCKAADRAAILTKQLLGFSRRQALLPKVMSPNFLVGQLQQFVRRTIGAAIDIDLDLDPLVEPIRVDPTQLELVLLNLTVNARDAMPDGGQLRLATENIHVDEAFSVQFAGMRPGQYVRLTVEDTGAGMAPEVQARAFEPFFTTKGLGTGTGLGLATAHAIVTESGGFVGLESRVGHGTKVSIYLPATAEPIEAGKCAEPTEAVKGGSETILLAEDDGAVRRLAREVLTKWGYSVLDARDGEEAIAVAERHQGPIALLISDVVMPGIGGSMLAAKLAVRHRKMRVLYTSGYTRAATLRGGVEYDAPLLAKPYLPLDLVRTVRAVLDGLDINDT
ncbi:MAG: ATP-binding protein [Hyphomicrobium sp.]|jgi:PAS domain S-box-containing protein